MVVFLIRWWWMLMCCWWWILRWLVSVSRWVFSMLLDVFLLSVLRCWLMFIVRCCWCCLRIWCSCLWWFRLRIVWSCGGCLRCCFGCLVGCWWLIRVLLVLVGICCWVCR